MLRTKAAILGLVLAAASLPGCLYSNVRAPLDTDVMETQLGDKEGRSTVKSVLWLFAWGDGGTAAAAKDGGLKTIRHLDSENFLILFGLYAERTVIAYGD
ncbi:MAG: TRL-like family protein [Planctomycetes bacterium]|nr:hypothetical protein [Planctomycetota bacterium]MBL8766860.1 TRL-like family protein [Planctomycetota bacterium]MCC7172538.1 TRL-like family protein [Planctomycetota bacterium]